ncbi:MAG: FAD-binding oxidoreductase [Burkholderiales bacterium]|nr:FAD-binding oxidoreductase [Burkholderiales bacterium]
MSVDGQTFDFIVIGAGMAGASAAAHLSRRGAVALLERETQPGYHSTGRSAALFSTIYGNAPVRALTRASQAFLFESPSWFTPVPLVSPRSTLFFATQAQAALLASFREDADVAAHTRVLDAAQADALVPAFRPGYLGGAVLEPGSADIDVAALHQGYLRLAKSRGAAVLLDCAIAGLHFAGGRWVLRTSQGTVSAPVVVNAAGAWGDEVARMAGARPVGLRPLRRTAMLVDPPRQLACAGWPAAIAIDESFYFKPDAGRLLLSPADEEPSPPCDAQPEDLEVAIAVDRFETATGEHVAKVHHRWAGLRVFSADRTPVVGFDPVAEGFFWLVGQGGYGIQSAEGLGRLTAALACDEGVPADLAAEGVTAEALARSRF